MSDSRPGRRTAASCSASPRLQGVYLPTIVFDVHARPSMTSCGMVNFNNFNILNNQTVGAETVEGRGMHAHEFHDIMNLLFSIVSKYRVFLIALQGNLR